MDDVVTVLYSDSGRFWPRKADQPVPVLGYLILPRTEGEILPKLGKFDFPELLADEGEPPRDDRFDEGQLSFMPTSATSTASVYTSVLMDPNFLANATSDLPASIEEISKSRAGAGLQVWDILAYYSALLRLRRLARPPRSILVRTDGGLPKWIEGRERITLDVNGRDVAPPLLATIRQVESRFDQVGRETIKGYSNIAELPIRQVIERERARARRVDTVDFDL